MSFLEIFRRKDLVSSVNWQEILLAFNRRFLSEYYQLPAGEETLRDFLKAKKPPDRYIQICETYLPIAESLMPLAHAECERLLPADRKALLQNKLPDYYGAYGEASTQHHTLTAFCEILKNPAAPSAFLVERQLSSLYKSLPDAHLPNGYNLIHDFYWRGVPLGKTPEGKEGLFLLRKFWQDNLPNPTPRVPNRGRGDPLPRVPDVRYREGYSRYVGFYEDYFDLIIEMDLGYWFNIEVFRFDKNPTVSTDHKSYSKKHGKTPDFYVRVEAKKDPDKFQESMAEYANLLMGVYQATHTLAPKFVGQINSFAS